MSACLVCGSSRYAPLFKASDRLYRTTAREFAVVRCGECGLLRLDPQRAAAARPAAGPRGTAPLLSGQLLVRARPKRCRPHGGGVPPAGAARPRAVCGAGAARVAGARAAARRGGSFSG
ncbi:hypothetical protein SBA4_3020030 [Candidatus Sulfopaludibacter sp. SbA4]|nr:hypothetical protein SBA4_3020030 [Candidatus Sulfopaludibacter sp. SbA4]